MSGRNGARVAVLVVATAVPVTIAYLAAAVYRKGRRAPDVDGSLNVINRPAGSPRTARPGPCCHPTNHRTAR